MKQVKDDTWRKKPRKMRRVLLKNTFFIPPGNRRMLFTGDIGRERLNSHTHWRNLYSHKHYPAGLFLPSLGRVVS